MCDDRLCQDCDNINRAVLEGRACADKPRPSVSVSSRPTVNVSDADTPQFREGNPYFFNENPYQSVSFIYASIYRENVHVIHIAMQFAKKSRLVK